MPRRAGSRDVAICSGSVEGSPTTVTLPETGTCTIRVCLTGKDGAAGRTVGSVSTRRSGRPEGARREGRAARRPPRRHFTIFSSFTNMFAQARSTSSGVIL